MRWQLRNINTDSICEGENQRTQSIKLEYFSKI